MANSPTLLSVIYPHPVSLPTRGRESLTSASGLPGSARLAEIYRNAGALPPPCGEGYRVGVHRQKGGL